MDTYRAHIGQTRQNSERAALTQDHYHVSNYNFCPIPLQLNLLLSFSRINLYPDIITIPAMAAYKVKQQ